MSGWIVLPGPPHRCIKPLVRMTGRAVFVGGVWKCYCGKMWRFRTGWWFGDFPPWWRRTVPQWHKARWWEKLRWGHLGTMSEDDVRKRAGDDDTER